MWICKQERWVMVPTDHHSVVTQINDWVQFKFSMSAHVSKMSLHVPNALILTYISLIPSFNNSFSLQVRKNLHKCWFPSLREQKQSGPDTEYVLSVTTPTKEKWWQTRCKTLEQHGGWHHSTRIVILGKVEKPRRAAAQWQHCVRWCPLQDMWGTKPFSYFCLD